MAARRRTTKETVRPRGENKFFSARSRQTGHGTVKTIWISIVARILPFSRFHVDLQLSQTYTFNAEKLLASLPTSKMKLVHAWIEIHRDELMADWRLAVQGEPVFKIDPLK